MGSVFSPCLHVVHWGFRVLQTLPEQMSQSPRYQHLSLGTMVPGCWDLSECWHRHVKDCCITLCKTGHFRIVWHRVCIPFQKHAFHWAHTSALTWAQPRKEQPEALFLSTRLGKRTHRREKGLNLTHPHHMYLCLSSLAEGTCWTGVLSEEHLPPHTFPVNTRTELIYFALVLSRLFTGAKF